MKYVGAGLAVLGICAMACFCMHLGISSSDLCCFFPIAIFGCIAVVAVICEN
jgi:hypothetical protein